MAWGWPEEGVSRLRVANFIVAGSVKLEVVERRTCRLRVAPFHPSRVGKVGPGRRARNTVIHFVTGSKGRRAWTLVP